MQARNQADAMVHSVRKSLSEHGDKLDAGEKDKIEAAIKDVEEAIKGDDKAVIDLKSEVLMNTSQKLGEKMYADAAQANAAAGAAGPQQRRRRAASAAADLVEAGGRQRGRRGVQGSQEVIMAPARRAAPPSRRVGRAGPSPVVDAAVSLERH